MRTMGRSDFADAVKGDLAKKSSRRRRAITEG
jgi:hypothetical protein